MRQAFAISVQVAKTLLPTRRALLTLFLGFDVIDCRTAFGQPLIGVQPVARHTSCPLGLMCPTVCASLHDGLSDAVTNRLPALRQKPNNHLTIPHIFVFI